MRSMFNIRVIGICVPLEQKLSIGIETLNIFTIRLCNGRNEIILKAFTDNEGE